MANNKHRNILKVCMIIGAIIIYPIQIIRNIIISALVYLALVIGLTLAILLAPIIAIEYGSRKKDQSKSLGIFFNILKLSPLLIIISTTLTAIDIVIQPFSMLGLNISKFIGKTDNYNFKDIFNDRFSTLFTLLNHISLSLGHVVTYLFNCTSININKINQRFIDSLNSKGLTVDQKLINGHSNIAIDRSEVYNIENYKKESAPVLIIFNGTGMIYQLPESINLDTTTIDLIQTGKPYYWSIIDGITEKDGKVVLFNYQNIGLSSNHPILTTDDLVRSGIAVVKDQLIKGVDPSLIVLYGHSMGGGVSALVYDHFRSKGIILAGLYNDRSFYSSTQVIANWLYNASPILSFIFSPIIKLTSILGALQMDTKSCYFKIDPSKRKIAAIAYDEKTKSGDGIITHNAGLHIVANEKEVFFIVNGGHVTTTNFNKNKEGKRQIDDIIDFAHRVTNKG